MTPDSALSTQHSGLVITRATPAESVESIRQAEAAGVPMAWSTLTTSGPDPLTFFAAAAMQTQRIGFGTAIVPTYTRHPAVMVSQVLALDGIAPGRLRLGLGPSHEFIIAGMFGLAFDHPLDHLREYLAVTRALLWEGHVEFQGDHFRVKTRIPPNLPPPRTPLPISALRAPAFRLAGEIADGAISWLCPVPYLVETALPALRAGAEAAGRPTPPLIGHVPVAMHADRDAIRAAAQEQIGRYARVAFYARMFADAGFPVGSDQRMPDALIDELVVSGDAATVAQRLRAIRAAGVDELMVSLVTVADPAAEEAAAAQVLGSL
jgi:F420-dependent oxidoreductase-like protein